MDGSLHLLGGDRYALHLSTESAAVARKSLRLMNDLFGLTGEVTVRRSKLSKANNYLVYIDWQRSLAQALNELGVFDDTFSVRQDVPGRLVKKTCCAIAYLRGLFLGGGFVSDPKGQYQLELATNNQAVAETCLGLLNRFEIRANVHERRGYHAVYIKQAQAIVDFLALVGAHTALLKWEDVRIFKDVRSKVNRLVNCDTANLNKAVTAALGQLSDIAKIESAYGLDRLPAALREIAGVRVANPEANLKELAAMCRPSLTKSAAYHRLRRLKELAATL